MNILTTARISLAAAALLAAGTSMAGDGLAKYYSLQGSKFYSVSASSVAPVVVSRTAKATVAAAKFTPLAQSSLPDWVSGSAASVKQLDSTTALASASYGLDLSSAARSVKDSTSTSSTVPTFSSGNVTQTVLGGVALNNVYVSGNLTITINNTGATWNYSGCSTCSGGSSQGGSHSGGVSKC